MVCIYDVKEYDNKLLSDCINNIFNDLNLNNKIAKGMNVVIKPDLMIGLEESDYTNTNTQLIYEIAKKVKLCGANVVIADRTDGRFNLENIDEEYKKLGMLKLEENNITLNRDLSITKVDVKSDEDIDRIQIINAIKNADLVINVPKLKTHNLFGLSGSVINMFGIITPESIKALYGKYNDSSKLSKIAFMISKSIKNQVTIIDAITAMEGDGPSIGSKVNFGHIIASDSIYEPDYIIAKKIFKKYDELPIIKEIIRTVDENKLKIIEVKGEVKKYRQFKMPKSMKKASLFGKKYWPVIDDKKCIKCKICIYRCPNAVIEEDDLRIKMAKRYRCTNCMYCVDQCPVGAITLKKMKVKYSKKKLQMLKAAEEKIEENK